MVISSTDLLVDCRMLDRFVDHRFLTLERSRTCPTLSLNTKPNHCGGYCGAPVIGIWVLSMQKTLLEKKSRKPPVTFLNGTLWLAPEKKTSKLKQPTATTTAVCTWARVVRTAPAQTQKYQPEGNTIGNRKQIKNKFSPTVGTGRS